MSHSQDTPCSCEHCQMLDVMWGDPLLNKWGREFVERVAEHGWYRNYSDKEKRKIEELFWQQRRKYVSQNPCGA
jgi:hypothetical protein